jgi:hypothetical protein
MLRTRGNRIFGPSFLRLSVPEFPGADRCRAVLESPMISGLRVFNGIAKLCTTTTLHLLADAIPFCPLAERLSCPSDQPWPMRKAQAARLTGLRQAHANGVQQPESRGSPACGVELGKGDDWSSGGRRM